MTGNYSGTLDATPGSVQINGDTSGGRLSFRGTTTSAYGGLGEMHGFWDTNKVASILFHAGSDTTNKDDGEIRMYTRLSGGSTGERLRITSEGYVKTPSQPYCMLGRGSTQSISSSSSTKIIFDTESIDRGGDFDTSNSRFTAPIDGDYLFCLIVQYTQNVNQCHAGLYKNNGGLGTAFDSWINWGDDTRAATITVVLQLVAGDYIEPMTYHTQGSNMNLEASRTKMTIRYLG